METAKAADDPVDMKGHEGDTKKLQARWRSGLLTAGVLAFNVAAALCIVVVNKYVLDKRQGYGWSFVYAMTLLHTLTTYLGMFIFGAMELYAKKRLNWLQLVPLTFSYIGYVVFNNLSLRWNTVGFYQLCKIAIAPVVLLMEVLMLGKRVTTQVVASVVLVCCGVALATVTDRQVTSSTLGMTFGFGAVFITALYQILAGTTQKHLDANSMQLLDQYCPLAALALLGTTICFEPLGLSKPTPDTLMGFPYSTGSVCCIALSCILGLAVNLSTFMVIGYTSSLTYNIVGHIKTVLILGSGCILFGDALAFEKFLGVSIALSGIVWYSVLKLRPAGIKTSSPPNPHTIIKQ